MATEKDNLSPADGENKKLDDNNLSSENIPKLDENSTEDQPVSTQEETDLLREASIPDESEKSSLADSLENTVESDSIPTSPEETTGDAPIDIHMESSSEDIKEDSNELPATNSENLMNVEKDELSSIAPTTPNEEISTKGAEADNAVEQVKDESVPSTPEETTGEAPVDIHLDSPAEEISKDMNALPNREKEDTDSEISKDNQDSPSEQRQKDAVKIPEKDYNEMSFSDLVTEAADLMKNYAPILLKDAFNNLRDTFRKKSEEVEKAAREKFLSEGGNAIDFRHDNPYATKFFDIYTEYRSKVEAYYKAAEAKQEENLKEREAIIAELKALYTEPAENNSQIFKKFRELKTRWHNAGRIPKANAGNIFKTYYFHLDNFNEFLDLNQELRKMDYDHNLEVRHSIIERAKALLGEDNVQKALNELQYLHRMWKEEGVPVAEEFREATWQEFKDLTSKIHDRKNELNEKIKKEQEENLSKKREVISKISSLIEDEVPKSHNAWQRKIKEMKALREEFFALGRVPKEDNQPTWDAFKEASKNFNHLKNDFYKQMKSEQMENLEKKRELVKIALEHRDSTDWNESVKVVKRIQSDWKKIGHVPRKFSDKIWKEFSDANNTFFDRYKNRNNEKLEKQQKNLEAKEALLKEMQDAQKPSDKDELLAWLNDYSIKWSSIGYVPNGKQDINKELSKLTEKILQDAGLNKDAIDKAQWDNQIDRIKSTLDESMLRNLKYDVRKQMDEVQKEVTHLQTNLAFFSNADESNPLFKNAIQNIENKVNELKGLESKLDDLKHINLEALAESQAENAEKEVAADDNPDEANGAEDLDASSDGSEKSTDA